jgi:hypothetical protein
LAATMRCGHLHLTALIVHHAAAGTLFGRHWRISDRTRHGRSQKRR